MSIVKTYNKKVAIEKWLFNGEEVTIVDETPIASNSFRIDTAYHGSFVCETFCGRDGNYYTRVEELID